MTRTLLHPIYRIVLVAALCAIFLGIAVLFHPISEGVAPAEEITGASGSYGELHPVW
jgi:hypothetical protein